MDTKLIIYIIVFFVYLMVVPYVKFVDESPWKVFITRVAPVRLVIMLIIYLIIF